MILVATTYPEGALNLNVTTSYGFANPTNSLEQDDYYAYSTLDGAPYIIFDAGQSVKATEITFKIWQREDYATVSYDSSSEEIISPHNNSYSFRTTIQGGNTLTSWHSLWSGSGASTLSERTYAIPEAMQGTYRYYKVTMKNFHSNITNIDFKRLYYFLITDWGV